MEFTYQARDSAGLMKTGRVEAVNETSAFQILQQHNLVVIKILPVSVIGALERIKFFERVSPKDIVLFSRQLSTLINAKVPIVQALTILTTQVSSDKLKSVITEVAQHVESGDSLSSPLPRYPKVFFIL